jgi:hypothetical protein
LTVGVKSIPALAIEAAPPIIRASVDLTMMQEKLGMG